MSDAARPPVFPILAPHLDVAPHEQPGALVVNGNGVRLVIGAEAWAVAQKFDGLRSCEEITAALQEGGATLPGDDFVLAFAESLAKAGLVQLADVRRQADKASRRDLPVVARAPLRFSCQSCGRSCTQHSVRVEKDVAQSIRERQAELGGKYPHLVGTEVIVQFGEEGVDDYRPTVLRQRDDGRCVFLDEDRLCILHKEFGAASKPLACRVFPVVFVETGDEIRVGIRATCYARHVTFDTEPPRQAAAIIGVPDDRVPTIVRHLNRSGVRQETALLQREPSSWGELLGELVETVLGIAPTRDLLQERAALAVLAEFLRRAAVTARQQTGLRRGELPSEDSHLGQVALLLTAIDDLPHAPEPVEPSKRQIAFFDESLRSWLYLRDWTTHGSPTIATFAFLLGGIVAAWRAPDGKLHPFALSLTAWTRLLQHHTEIPFGPRDELRDNTVKLAVAIANSL